MLSPTKKPTAMDESAQVLREEASLAHRRGDIESAAAIFRRILELYPHSPEGLDARVYLSGLPARFERTRLAAGLARLPGQSPALPPRREWTKRAEMPQP